MTTLPHPLTPVEDRLGPGSADADLQALFDQLYADQEAAAAALAERSTPARHRQAALLHQACAAAQRLIVEVWLRRNPDAS